MGRRTKHSREDEDVTKDQLESSDDQESRARAITKKTRLDPFGDGNGKKKRKKQMAPKDGTSSTSMPPSVPGPTNTEISEQAEVIAMITEPSTTDAPNTVVSSAQPLTKNPSAKSSVDEIQVSPAKPTPTPSGSVDKTSRSTPKEPLGKHLLFRLPSPFSLSSNSELLLAMATKSSSSCGHLSHSGTSHAIKSSITTISIR